MIDEHLDKLSDQDLREAIERLEEMNRKRALKARLENYAPYPKQMEFHSCGAKYRQRLLSAGNQLGKMSWVEEPVLTPGRGWVRIGDIQVGDEIIAGDGSVTTVTGVYPQGVVPLIKVFFDNGQSHVCGADHLWKVMVPGVDSGWKVHTTRDLRRIGGNDPALYNRFYIPAPGPAQLYKRELPVDPYLLGLVIIRGFVDHEKIRLRFPPHPKGRNRIPERLAAWVTAMHALFGLVQDSRSSVYWHVTRPEGVVKAMVEQVGLGQRRTRWRIPKDYLLSDVRDRANLLFGLLDGEKMVMATKGRIIGLSSFALATDVVELIRSLGGEARMEIAARNTTWRVDIIAMPKEIFALRVYNRLSDAAYMYMNTHMDVAMTAFRDVNPGEAVCIAVAHPDKTYVVGGWLVTHNTYAGAAETTYHATGRYPEWWKGRRFTRPVSILAGSESGELTRDGMQRILLGPPAIEEEWGTGMIPQDALAQHPKRRPGVKDAVDAIVVKHVQGGSSVIRFKSFDQGRSKWQADTVDAVWLDEEPPYDVYEEAVTRTNAVQGPVYITFTPLKGMSSVVRMFFTDPGKDKIVVRMTIKDVEHYSAEQRELIAASYTDLSTRDARLNGEPVLGSGRVFPVLDELVQIDPIFVPDHWAIIGGMDFGYDHPFAAVECAWDRDTDIFYVVREFRQRMTTPADHCQVLRKWGDDYWVWPHDGYQHDKGSGLQLAKQYKNNGLHIHSSHVTFDDGTNGVEAGVFDMLTRMNEGRWKVFSTCPQWMEEFRLYHRKEGVIVATMDDLICASRYALMGRRFARARVKRDFWERAGRRGLTALGTGEVPLSY